MPSSPDAAVGTPPLQRHTSYPRITATPEKRQRKSILALAAGACAIVVVLVYFSDFAVRHSSAPPPALEITRLTDSGDVGKLDISPDGKFVAYQRFTPGGESIWIKHLATDSDIKIATLDKGNCPGLAFSPDGGYIYYVQQPEGKDTGDLYQIPLLGGMPKKMMGGISGSPAFSPNGRRIAYVRGSYLGEYSLRSADLDGSGERVLASYKEPEAVVGTPAWSPDGRTLAFLFASPQESLSTIPAEGGGIHPVPGVHFGGIANLAWLPGTRRLLVAGTTQEGAGPKVTCQLYEVPVEGGEIRQITHDLAQYQDVHSSADGKTLLSSLNQLNVTLQVVTPGREPQAKIVSTGDQTTDGWMGLAWAPNGKIVYMSIHKGYLGLWKMGADGSNAQQLTDTSRSYMPAASPRGNFIAFIRLDGFQSSVWRMDMDGGNKKQLTQGNEDLVPTVSPDGQWVIFARAFNGKFALMKVPSGGGPAIELTDKLEDNAYWPTVSPDGKWIAGVYNPHGSEPGKLAIFPFAGGPPDKIFPLPPGAGQWPQWTPDGSAISFLKGDNIWEQPVAGGPLKQVTHFSTDFILDYSWSPDGRVVVSRGKGTKDAVLIRNFQ
jgi:Tol biopolymer transport system component